VPDDRTSSAGAADLARQINLLLVLLDVLREARHARTTEALRFVFVNRARRLFEYRQAVFLTLDPSGKTRVGAVSNVAVPERDAPFIRWVEAAARAVASSGEAARLPHIVGRESLPSRLQDDFDAWGFGTALWCPLPAPDGALPAALWITRDGDWTDAEMALLTEVSEAFGSAWAALAKPAAPRRVRRRRTLVSVAAATLLFGVLALPVSRSTLAPAEIAPVDPLIVAAPLEGVIDRFYVQPNQKIVAGQPLFGFEPTVLRARAEIARKALTSAEAEYMTATQSAFSDARATTRLAQLKAQADLRRAELSFAVQQLDRITVKADRSGIVIFADVNDWLGRPVAVGERILTIADPAAAEVEIHVPVADALDLENGAPVRLFLNVDPLRRISARIRHASYEPGLMPGGTLAYRVQATLEGDAEKPRIGLHGTAKIEGKRVPLALYLFRRPLAAIRQTLGL
jgi:multidrug resistance efflux pump